MTPVKPVLSALRPDGWFAKESLTLLSPDGQSSVISTAESLAPDVDTDRYASIQGDLLRKEFPGYREFSYEPAIVFGRYEGYLRQFEWIPPDGAPVTQLQIYFARAGRGHTATATMLSIHAKVAEPRLRDILAGLRIDNSTTA